MFRAKRKKMLCFRKIKKRRIYGYTNITLFTLIINKVSNSIITICTRQCIVLRLYINWTNIYFISYYICVNFGEGNFVITLMHEIVHAKVYILVRIKFSSNTVMFSTKYFLSDTNEWSKSFVNIFFGLYNVVAWCDEETPSTTRMIWLQWIKTYRISNVKRICFVISHIMTY